MEDDEARLKDVNAYFENGRGFISCDDESLSSGWYGGTKMLETNVAIGALNHLSLDEFVKHLEKIEWDEPENVQLIVQEQEDEKFQIIELPEKNTDSTS